MPYPNLFRVSLRYDSSHYNFPIESIVRPRARSVIVEHTTRSRCRIVLPGRQHRAGCIHFQSARNWPSQRIVPTPRPDRPACRVYLLRHRCRPCLCHPARLGCQLQSSRLDRPGAPKSNQGLCDCESGRLRDSDWTGSHQHQTTI